MSTRNTFTSAVVLLNETQTSVCSSVLRTLQLGPIQTNQMLICKPIQAASSVVCLQLQTQANMSPRLQSKSAQALACNAALQPSRNCPALQPFLRLQRSTGPPHTGSPYSPTVAQCRQQRPQPGGGLLRLAACSLLTALWHCPSCCCEQPVVKLVQQLLLQGGLNIAHLQGET